MNDFRCEACCIRIPASQGIRCDDCMAVTIEGLLNDKNWLVFRGVAKGDLPGETLADTMRRELKALKGE